MTRAFEAARSLGEAALVAATVLLVASGCGTDGPGPSVERPIEARPSAPSAGPAAEVGGQVVSTVDGEAITVAEVEEVVRLTGLGPLAALRRLQEERALAHRAAASPVADDPEVAAATRRALVRQLLASEVEAPHPPEAIPAAAVEQRAREISGALASPETRRASHVMVALPADAPEARVDAAFRLARRMRDELRAQPSPSAALDAYAGRQGAFDVVVERLDPMPRDELEQTFADALFEAPGSGLVEEPVRSSYGVHVIVLEEIVPPWEVPREEWEPVLRRQLAAEARVAATEALVERLASRTPVTIAPAGVQLAESFGLGAQDGAGSGAPGPGGGGP
jgi:hypothetical protein